MKNQKSNVILVNYSDGKIKQKKINVGIWSAEEKEAFLSKISAYESFDNVCSFNIHHDTVLTHVPAHGAIKQFIPTHSQNKKNQVIIEIIPDMSRNECWATCETSCIECLKTGGCQSYPIKTLIGMRLFKEQYTK